MATGGDTIIDKNKKMKNKVEPALEQNANIKKTADKATEIMKIAKPYIEIDQMFTPNQYRAFNSKIGSKIIAKHIKKNRPLYPITVKQNQLWCCIFLRLFQI